MPASVGRHNLAKVRARLKLTQTEMADLVGCSPTTIKAVEIDKLALSESLATRISVSTGADLDWLLKNDLTEPMPPIRRPGQDSPGLDHDGDATMMMLFPVFDRLFAIARRQPKKEGRRLLALQIGFQLDALKNSESDPLDTWVFESGAIESHNEVRLDPELEKMINFQYLVESQRARHELIEKEHRKADRERKKIRKEINSKSLDQLSEDEKTFLKADKELEKFRRKLKTDVKTQLLKEAGANPQNSKSPLPKRQKSRNRIPASPLPDDPHKNRESS